MKIFGSSLKPNYILRFVPLKQKSWVCKYMYHKSRSNFKWERERERTMGTSRQGGLYWPKYPLLYVEQLVYVWHLWPVKPVKRVQATHNFMLAHFVWSAHSHFTFMPTNIVRSRACEQFALGCKWVESGPIGGQWPKLDGLDRARRWLHFQVCYMIYIFLNFIMHNNINLTNPKE